MAWCLACSAAQAAETAPAVDAPLVIGSRTILVFRAPMGAFSAAERAEGARQRILAALQREGEGWTSTWTTPQGMMVLLDGKPMFTVVPGDARELAGESPQLLADGASRMLRRVWTEARERHDPRAATQGAWRVAAAALAWLVVVVCVVKATGALRRAIATRLAARLAGVPVADLGARLAAFLPGMASRLCILLAWLLVLFAFYVLIAYSLAQFAVTRPVGEGLAQSLSALLGDLFGAVAQALPGGFIAALIFLMAWVVTQVSAEFFRHIATHGLRFGVLDAHTAPATRRIANASIWLFAVAMAYPYLPGAHTDAFRGLSVILGLMVSIGASGLVGQVASGVMLVYTHAVAVGEYVRIQDCEGTVTELGLFVTRLRTGMGEEIALPNALVLANVIRNYSRAAPGSGFVLDAAVTIGYDTPWRQVHALLQEAARAVPAILAEPAPFVVQTALSDFYVGYKLVVNVGAEQPAARALVASDLHAAIQDAFNRHGVQIMSPHYFRDPATPKIVAPGQWYAAPASAPRSPPARPA